jgi:hypothetical protein
VLGRVAALAMFAYFMNVIVAINAVSRGDRAFAVGHGILVCCNRPPSGARQFLMIRMLGE